MALWFECMLSCARNLIDTADIVREAIFQQLSGLKEQFSSLRLRASPPIVASIKATRNSSERLFKAFDVFR